MLQNYPIDSNHLRVRGVKMLKIISVLILTTAMSCSANIYTSISDQNTEQALLENAVKAINNGDYDSAIEYIGRITSSFRRDPKVSKTAAAAYAGKCGLNFFDMVTTITAVTADTPLMMMMKAFQTVTVTPSSCNTAQLEIENKYGMTSAARPTDINLFLAILGMAKMGTYLRSLADVNQDAVVDAGFADACTVGTITDANTIEVGTGLGLLLDNITSLTASVAGNAAITALAALQLVCGAPCVITDVNSPSWTAANIKVIRSAIKSNTFGIQGCANAPFVTCCP